MFIVILPSFFPVIDLRLCSTHQQVDDSEVFLQAVAHEAHAGVDEEPELQVRRLQRGQVLRGDLSVQVSGFDSRILSQVVHHLQGDTQRGVR